jgi:hypothetical protein
MKILYVIPELDDRSSPSHIDYIRSAAEWMTSKGSEVHYLPLGSNSFPAKSGTIQPSPELPEGPYVKAFHRYSDAVLMALQDLHATHQFDAIEFPGFGGLGFSTIRAKRTLGLFANCKLGVVLLETPNSAEQLLFDRAVSNFMEQYCFRFADLILSADSECIEAIKTSTGRRTAMQFDRDSLTNSISVSSEPIENDHADLPTVDQCYEGARPRFYSSASGRQMLTIFIVFDPAEPAAAATIPEFLQNPFVEILHLPPSNKLNQQEAYQAFTPTIGEKIDPDVDPLKACCGDYVLRWDGRMRVSEGWLAAILKALTRNAEIACVRTYCKTDPHVPLGVIPLLFPLKNHLGEGGCVFRKNSLLQLPTGAIDWSEPDSAWLAALYENYHQAEVIPSTLMDSVSIPEDNFSPTAILTRLKRYPRLWTTHASQLVEYLIECQDAEPDQAEKSGDFLFKLPDVELPSERVPEQISERNEPADAADLEATVETDFPELDEEPEPAEEGSFESGTPEPQEATIEPQTEGIPEDNNDWFQVFWSTGESFSETQAKAQPYTADTDLCIEFQIDSASQIHEIRLDPSNRPGLISLRRVEIWDDESHLPIFSSSEENAFDNIKPGDGIEVKGIERDALLLEAMGNDPQILIDMADFPISRCTITVEFGFRRNGKNEIPFA